MTVETRVQALETRMKAVEATLRSLIEAVNKCVTMDQVQQLEILNGTELDALGQAVDALSSDVDLIRSQIQI